MDDKEIKHFVEAALLAAGRPLSIDQLQNLFEEGAAPEKPQIREAIGKLREEYEERGLTIAEVASGFRTQIKSSMAERLGKLWEERPPRYSRALFETLALIAYRQPMTRGEIEEIRGVAVSTNIVRTLMERDWIRVVGHRDVPGRPAMFGTTKQFLDYFGLKKLDDLPPLADLSDWESLRVQLNLPSVDQEEEPEPESADVTELPVLHIEDDENVRITDGEEAAGAAAGEAGDSDRDAGDAAANLEDESATEAGAGEGDEDSGFEEIIAREWPDPRGTITIATDGPDDEDELDLSTVGARRARD
jgi:segregation and condensation protein B